MALRVSTRHWALTDYGFKVVIAPSFADIFYGNSFNNQLLPVKLSDAEVDELFALVKANPGIHFDVDLEAQEVKAGENLSLYHRCLPPPLHDERSGQYWAYLAARRRHCRL